MKCKGVAESVKVFVFIVDKTMVDFKFAGLARSPLCFITETK